MKNRLLGLFAVLLVSWVGINAQNPVKEWTEAKNITGNFKAIMAQKDIEVFSSPNVILLKVNQTSEVRLFTILGKLIVSEKLKPGIYEYHLDAHGIYIIKTDDTSCKIAI